MQAVDSLATQILERIKKARKSQPAESEYLMNGYRPSTQSYECPVCRDQNGKLVPAIVPDGFGGEQEIEVWRECECVERKRVQRIMKSSRITPEFQRLTFDNFRLDKRPSAVQTAFVQANYYVEHFEELRGKRQNSIGFHGRPGSGKTHLLMAVANALLAKGVSVLYFPWVTGTNELRASVKQDGEYLKKLHAMQSVDVLFIDDLYKGRKYPTDFQTEFLFDVVNERYLHHLPILLSSEKTPDEIMSMRDEKGVVVGEGVGSRLYEMTKNYLSIMELQPGEEDLILNYRLMP